MADKKKLQFQADNVEDCVRIRKMEKLGKNKARAPAESDGRKSGMQRKQPLHSFEKLSESGIQKVSAARMARRSGVSAASKSAEVLRKSLQGSEKSAGEQTLQEGVRLVGNAAGFRKLAGGYSQKVRGFQKDRTDGRIGRFFRRKDRGIRGAGDSIAEKVGRSGVHPMSKMKQKQAIQQQYVSIRTGRSALTAAPALGSMRTQPFRKRISKFTKRSIRYAAKHPYVLLAVLVIVLSLALLIGGVFSMTSVISQGVNVGASSSYTLSDRVLKRSERWYVRQENALKQKASQDASGKEADLAETGHDPYQLAALLTVMMEARPENTVRQNLKEIFKTQYSLETAMLTKTGTETKTVKVGEYLGKVVTSGYCNCSICCGKYAGGKTATGTLPRANHTIAVDAYHPTVPLGTKVVMNGVEYVAEDTGAFHRYGVDFDVYYDSHAAAQAHGHKTWDAYLADDNGQKEVRVIAASADTGQKTTLSNIGMDGAAKKLGLSKDEQSRYKLLRETKGLRDGLFQENEELSNRDDAGISYSVPPEALSDERFARMLKEAQKYLNVPYVWSGYSPSGFDCSGFVSWVLNHCGNGWNFGRLTAEGLRQKCKAVKPEDAKPGDLIFFQNTYATAGASHVGIYVGNDTMIHCGKPVQFSKINRPYWKSHFLSYGRLPN